jgi:hypothetical protein
VSGYDGIVLFVEYFSDLQQKGIGGQGLGGKIDFFSPNAFAQNPVGWGYPGKCWPF